MTATEFYKDWAEQHRRTTAEFEAIADRIRANMSEIMESVLAKVDQK